MQPVSQEFYRIQKLPPYVFAVINEMKAKARAAGLDIVDMGMGNPDGATPRPIVSKLVEAARNPRNHRYSLSKGIPHLREEMVKRYQRNYGVTLDAEKEAIITIGAKDALAHLLFAVIGPGDTVVSPNPCYPIHQYGVIMAEGHACVLPMPDPASFINSLEDVYRKSSKPPRMILISFPHNPTTQCVDLDFMKEIVRLARHHGTMVVHDFAYADLGFDGYKPPSILQIAAIIALRECEEDTKKICATYQKRRDALVEGLNRAGWPVEPPRGTMFLWAPMPEPYRAQGSLEFSKMLLDKALVAVSPGIGFGPLGEGFVRFSLIENPQRTRQATSAIKKMLKGT